jgi:hypothetical protein
MGGLFRLARTARTDGGWGGVPDPRNRFGGISLAHEVLRVGGLEFGAAVPAPPVVVAQLHDLDYLMGAVGGPGGILGHWKKFENIEHFEHGDGSGRRWGHRDHRVSR